VILGPGAPNEGRPTPLHIWDFGGQDVYLGTHALFLRTRAIFLIVWTRSSEEGDHSYAGVTSKNFPLAYWVEYVAQMGGREWPVLLIQNQCDRERAKTPRVDAGLLDSFAFHRVLAYSAKTKQGQAGLIEALQQAVAHVHETEGLARIGGGRAYVKRKLEERRDAAQVMREHSRADPAIALMSKDDFAALCTDEACLAVGGVSNQEALFDYLHQIGTIFYRPGLFGGRILVDQQWALEAIYAIFERESGVYKHIRKVRRGRFTRSELAQFVWNAAGHGEAEQELFLDMMRSCRIAFPLHELGPFDDETEYLAPDLLPPKEAIANRIDWDDGEKTKEAVFPYDLLPPGLLRSIMAEIGEPAGVAATYWQDGFSFYERRTRSHAIVEQLREKQGWGGRIEIRTQRGDAETLLLALTELVNASQVRLGVEAEWGRYYRRSGSFVDKLGALLEEKPAKKLALIAKSTAAALSNIRLRADAIEGRRELEPVAAPQPPNACYLSYAWGSSSPDAGPEDSRRQKEADELCEKARRLASATASSIS
jgi:internalin A